MYALAGDGSVDAEIVIGDDLTAAEMEPGIWEPAEVGRIRLPTGRLCVHSYNTLPMGDNGDEPEDRGAIVEVPAGDYRVTLHREDWVAMEEEGVADLDEAFEAGVDVLGDERVDDVLVLTPLTEAGSPEGPNFLFRACVGL